MNIGVQRRAARDLPERAEATDRERLDEEERKRRERDPFEELLAQLVRQDDAAVSAVNGPAEHAFGDEEGASEAPQASVASALGGAMANPLLSGASVASSESTAVDGAALSSKQAEALRAFPEQGPVVGGPSAAALGVARADNDAAAEMAVPGTLAGTGVGKAPSAGTASTPEVLGDVAQAGSIRQNLAQGPTDDSTAAKAVAPSAAAPSAAPSDVLSTEGALAGVDLEGLGAAADGEDGPDASPPGSMAGMAASGVDGSGAKGQGTGTGTGASQDPHAGGPAGPKETSSGSAEAPFRAQEFSAPSSAEQSAVAEAESPMATLGETGAPTGALGQSLSEASSGAAPAGEVGSLSSEMLLERLENLTGASDAKVIEGEGEARWVELRHPELGEIRLQMQLSDGAMDVAALAESFTAASSLRRSEDRLRRSLGRHGVSLRMRVQSDSAQTQGRTRRRRPGSRLDMEA